MPKNLWDSLIGEPVNAILKVTDNDVGVLLSLGNRNPDDVNLDPNLGNANTFALIDATLELADDGVLTITGTLLDARVVEEGAFDYENRKSNDLRMAKLLIDPLRDTPVTDVGLYPATTAEYVRVVSRSDRTDIYARHS